MRVRMRRAIAIAGVAWLGGCGLVLDLQEPAPDAGPPGMDARVVMVDAGDPPPECTSDDGCPDDGDACTTAERCVEGRCVADEVTCDDGIDCTDDSCDPSQGCTHRADDAVCAEVLPEGDCRVPRCDPLGGCLLEPSDAHCDDGFACTRDACRRDGVCVNEADDVACATSVAPASVCEPFNGGVAGSGCTEVECFEDADCALVAERCVVSGQCLDNVCRPQHVADDTACDDGLFCTTASSCQSGICVASTRLACGDDNACTTDTCVEGPTEAICMHAPDPAQVAAPCDDGVPCTGPGQCRSDGSCEPGVSTCFANADRCQVATCTGGACSIASPCEDANRLCIGGVCDACEDGFADCDGVGGCECALGPGRGCVARVCGNTTLDAGVVVDASARVDAAPRVDAGARDGGGTLRDAAPRDGMPDGCLRPDPVGGGLCPGGFEDCDDDGCCECDRASHFCGIDETGADGCVENISCTEVCNDGAPCCACTGTCTPPDACLCSTTN